ncbi:heme exporter protein CcmB [Chitinophagales bacterium]|nr:heme exporter protein CcmB [Chitinophagales bacterium]
MNRLFHLIEKEFRLEWRNKTVISGLLLYLSSSIFLLYMGFEKLDQATWPVAYWIILLFAAANALAKSFVAESDGQFYYSYSLHSPENIILSKLIYNACLLLLMALVALAVFSLLLGNFVIHSQEFFLTVVLGCISMSSVYTMASAVSWKAGGNAVLLPILAFPVMIPILVLLVKLSQSSCNELWDPNLYKNLGTLGVMNVLIWAVAYILFPYLWRDS